MEYWPDHNGQLYPAGTRGELAVGYYLAGKDTPELIPVATMEEARSRFAEITKGDDPMRVVLTSGEHAGRRSAVAFIVRCDHGTNWNTIAVTSGMAQEFPESRLEIPDVLVILRPEMLEKLL